MANNLPGTTTNRTDAPQPFECQVCHGRLVDPVTFPKCFHSVCLTCAQKQLAANTLTNDVKCGFGCGTVLDSNALTVNVALRAVVGGASSLEQQNKNASNSGLCGCGKRPASVKCETCGLLCAKHYKQVHELPIYKSHVVIDLGNPPTPLGSPKRCPIHKKEKRELFCKQCNEVICDKCWIVGSHRKHECVDLDQAKKEIAPQIRSKEVHLSERRTELTTFKEKLETTKTETEVEEKTRCTAIEQAINEMHKLLEEKKIELCNFVETKQKSRYSTLDAQIHSVEDQLASVNCGISCAEMSNKRVSEEDPFAFVSFGVVAIHAASLATQFPSGSALVPGASAQLEEAPLDCSHLSAVIRDLQLLPPVDATQSKIVRTETGQIFLGNEPIVVATIQVCDKTGQPSTCTSGLTCSCSSPGNDGTTTKILMEENAEKGRGHLTVRMTPSPTGDHTLTVKFNNVHIVGSPLVIPVVVDRAFRGSKILTTRELDNKLHEMVVGAEGAMGHKMTNTTWRLLWRGSDHGFTAAKFHELCDNIASALVIVRSSSNYIFGGYSHLPFINGWQSGCGGRTFLYSLVRAGTTTGTILRCKGHSNCIYGGRGYGPTYGPCHCLYICDNCNTNTGSYTSVDNASYMETPPHNPPNEYLAGTYNTWLVSEIEVWAPL